MKIFIDHQYKTIYNGEFVDWITNNIINVLQSNNELYVASTKEETQNVLGGCEFDFVIITGYDSITLTSINQKFKNTKTIAIIYDLNAEKMAELFGNNETISDIIALKSRLIFLCNHIVTTSELIKHDIIELYSGYEKVGISIKNKVSTIKNNFKSVSCEDTRLIQDKYIVIQDSVNGLSAPLNEYQYILNSIKERADDLPNIKFVIVMGCVWSDFDKQNLCYDIAANNLHDSFRFFIDISEQELANLYKNAICVLFPSTYDTNIDKILLAYSLNSISLLNPQNDIYNDSFEEYGMFYNEEDNIIDVVRSLMRANKQDKLDIKDSQNRGLFNYINKIDSSILSVLNKLINQ